MPKESKIIEFEIPSGATKGKVKYNEENDSLDFAFETEDGGNPPSSAKKKNALKEFFLGGEDD